MARDVYFALFDSHLRYGIPFWVMSSRYLLNILVVLQKKAVRYIVGASQRQSCRPIFVDKKILTLSSLFILETATLVHKNIGSMERLPRLHDTRGADNLPLPIPTSTLIKKSLIYESKKMYNHLPADIKSLHVLRSFRVNLKRLLVSKAYYSIAEFYADSFI